MTRDKMRSEMYVKHTEQCPARLKCLMLTIICNIIIIIRIHCENASLQGLSNSFSPLQIDSRY